MKKIISTLLSLAIVIGAFPTMIAMADESTTVEYAGGDGTANSPYLISNADQLKKMRDEVNANNTIDTGAATAHYRLTADIDLQNAEWTPIGLHDNYGFRGTFDGNGHVVKNFKITETSKNGYGYVGFFGGVANPTIKNFGIDNAQITVTGGIAGGMVGRGAITLAENCFVKNSTINSSSGMACGFTGRTRNKSKYRNCYVYNCATYGSTRVAFTNSENFNQHGTGDVLTNCYVAEMKESKFAFFLGTHNNNENHNSTAAPKVTNCFSNVATEGNPGTIPCTNGGTSHTHDNIVAGIYGATKDGIAAAMVNSGAYMVSDTINGGYPHLNFENPSTVKAWDGVSTENYGGTGTQADPYTIANAAQLAKFSADVNSSETGYKDSSKYVKLTADIDLGGKVWTPIGHTTNTGTVVNTFGGTFDGDGHIVKNFTVSGSQTHGGLFGYTNATIKNLGVENATINKTSGGHNGVIAGKGTLKLYDCYVKNSKVTSGSGRAGGLVGSLRGASTIENCYTDGVTVSGTQANQVGCLVGQAENVDEGGHKFINCYTANGSGGHSILNNAGRTNADKWTVTNVFTTGTNMTNNIGETKTAAEISSELIATGKYKAGDGALPVLTWETVEDLSGVNPYVVAAVSANNDKTVNVTLVENKAATGTLYVASYDAQGRFVAMDEFNAATAKATVKTTNVKSDAPTIKVFVWDASQTPIAKAYTK